MTDQQFVYDASQNLSANTFVKNGYKFAGWTTTEDGTEVSYTDAQEVLNLLETGSMTLYAKWTPNSYSVKFDPTTGTGNMPEQPFEYDARQNLSTNTFTKKGYTFTGWTTTEDGTEVTYTDGQLVLNLLETGSMTLYAKWAPNNYTVEYDNNTGSGEMESQAFVYDTSQNLSVNTFTKKGYTFTGWSTTKNGKAESYTDGQLVLNLLEKGSMTLYAQWIPNNYTIEFDNNTGTGEMENQVFEYDVQDLLSKNLFTKEYYTFVGWNTKTDGTGTDYVNEQEVINMIASGSQTLYAQWVLTSIELEPSTEVVKPTKPGEGLEDTGVTSNILIYCLLLLIMSSLVVLKRKKQ